MPDNSPNKSAIPGPSEAAANPRGVLAWAGIGLSLGLYLVVFFGLLFHSTGGPIFGRYSLLTGLSLGLMLLLFVPALKFLFFVTEDTPFTASNGETLVLKSSYKLQLLTALGLLIFVPIEISAQWKAARPSKKKILKFHPSLQLQGRPNHSRLHTNAHGFRGEEVAMDKPNGTFRVLFMGGSTVYCDRSAWEQTHVRLLETKLREQFPKRKIEVLNTGMHWYTSQHSLQNYLFRLQDFEPDLVILYHGINDLCRSFSPEKLSYGPFRSDYGHYFGPVARLVLKQHRAVKIPTPQCLHDFVNEVLFSDLRSLKPHSVKDFPSLKSFRRNMRRFAQILKLDKVPLILCSQAFIYRQDLDEKARAQLWMNSAFCQQGGVYPDLESMARGMNQFNEASRAIAREAGLPFVELEPHLPKDLEHFHDDVHTTEKANAIIAERVFQRILAERLIKNG